MNSKFINVVNQCLEIFNDNDFVKGGYGSMINHIIKMKNNKEPLYDSIKFDYCPKCGITMPTINHICIICENSIHDNVQETSNTNIQVPEFIQKMDWKEFRTQKEHVLGIISWGQLGTPVNNALQGIVHILDAIQDYAVDIAGYSETDVYLFDMDDQKEEIK